MPKQVSVLSNPDRNATIVLHKASRFWGEPKKGYVLYNTYPTGGESLISPHAFNSKAKAREWLKNNYQLECVEVD